MSSWLPMEQTSETTHTKNNSIKKILGHWDKSCCLMADNVCLIVSKPPGSRSCLTIHDILTASHIVPISHKTVKWVVLRKLCHLCLKFSFIWKGYCWICRKSYFCTSSLKYHNWNIDTGASSYTIWNSDMGISIAGFFSHYRGQFNLILKLFSIFFDSPNVIYLFIMNFSFKTGFVPSLLHSKWFGVKCYKIEGQWRHHTTFLAAQKYIFLNFLRKCIKHF